MPVDAHASHHLVLDLDQIAGVEEVAGGEERILDPVRVSVEAAVFSKRRHLGGRGSGLSPGGRWELTTGEQPPDTGADGGEELCHGLIARWGRGVNGEVAWLRLAEDAVHPTEPESICQRPTFDRTSAAKRSRTSSISGTVGTEKSRTKCSTPAST